MNVQVIAPNVRHNGASYRKGDVLSIEDKHYNDTLFITAEGGSEDGQARTEPNKSDESAVRAPGSESQGQQKELEEMTVPQLKEQAEAAGIEGYKRMKRDALLAELKGAQANGR